MRLLSFTVLSFCLFSFLAVGETAHLAEDDSSFSISDIFTDTENEIDDLEEGKKPGETCGRCYVCGNMGCLYYCFAVYNREGDRIKILPEYPKCGKESCNMKRRAYCR